MGPWHSSVPNPSFAGGSTGQAQPVGMGVGVGCVGLQSPESLPHCASPLAGSHESAGGEGERTQQAEAGE